MRRLILATMVLAVCVPILAQVHITFRRGAAGAPDSQSLLFDEVNDYISITDHADMDIAANSDWTIMMWLYVTDMAGSNWEYVFSTGSFGATDTMNMFIRDTSTATPHQVKSRVDINTVDLEFGSGATEMVFDAWRLMAWIYDESATDMFIKSCDTGGTCTTIATGNINFNDALDMSTFECGRRADGNADRYYGNLMAYCAYCEKEFTSSELSTLASGTKANFEAEEANCTFFLDETLAADLTSNCGGSGCTVTQFGSPVTDSNGPFD